MVRKNFRMGLELLTRKSSAIPAPEQLRKSDKLPPVLLGSEAIHTRAEVTIVCYRAEQDPSTR